MASQTPRTIEDVPLHVVALILGQLDTIQQLKNAALSHRIFREAFKDNIRSTAQSVIGNQIPEEILPFSLALLESNQAAPNGAQAALRVMKDLKDEIGNPNLISENVAGLALSDYDFLSRTHTAVMSLGEAFCRHSLPLFTKWLGPGSTVEATPRDHFRIHRALYRHQIMCELLCRPPKDKAVSEGPAESDREENRAKMVLLGFSTWVNEQLVCIYFWLQRTVMNAHDDVAAHDITWGELPVTWTDEEWWVDPMESRVQEYVGHGLEFLNSVAKAETFNERAALFEKAKSEWFDSDARIDYGAYPHDKIALLGYYSDVLENEGLESEERLARAHELGLLRQVTGSCDGPDGPLSSTPFRTWLAAQSDKSLFWSICDHDSDANLWECGYVIWEASAQIPEDQLQNKIAALRRERHFFQRLRARVDDEVIQRSERIRSMLYFTGAKGYWPLEGVDFSGVRDLPEDCKQRILEKWRADPNGWYGKPMSSMLGEVLQKALNDVETEDT
ncbi:hypothetical protein CC79DRAFT_1402164 [Sarocladium strictum]